MHKLLFRFLLILGLSACYSPGHAACSNNLRAVPHSLPVSIGDGGCSYDGEMIINGDRPRPGHHVDHVTTVLFDSQCQSTTKGFTCRDSGSTVLAGTTYQKVPGNRKVCGDRRWPIYRCISGCNRPGTPEAFEIEPYEC